METLQEDDKRPAQDSSKNVDLTRHPTLLTIEVRVKVAIGEDTVVGLSI